METLDFTKVRERMINRGIIMGSSVNTSFRTIDFPIDKNFTYGRIVLLEFYAEEEGFYFLYIQDNDFSITDEPMFDKDNYIYKIDLEGNTVSEGKGLLNFEKSLTPDKLARLGAFKDEIPSIKENLPIFVKKLLSVIDYEIKNTIRSNAESFIMNIS